MKQNLLQKCIKCISVQSITPKLNKNQPHCDSLEYLQYEHGESNLGGKVNGTCKV